MLQYKIDFLSTHTLFVSYKLVFGINYYFLVIILKGSANMILNPLRRVSNKIYDLLCENIISEKIYLLFHGNSMIPPKSMTAYVGRVDDFEKYGMLYRNYFIELAQLEKNAKVLDVGSGIGRNAVALTSYLNETGSYYGIDIVRHGIDWCNEKISTKYPNFKFIHSDILNKRYNEKGSILAREYKFPFEDATFDFVFLTSVFTHMFPEDIDNYMKEISRVLKHKGNCFITFFIINSESKILMAGPKSSYNFQFHGDRFFCAKEHNPEAAIAFEEDYIVSLFKSNGMTIDNSIHYGSWCGRDNYTDFQDIVVATKN